MPLCPNCASEVSVVQRWSFCPACGAPFWHVREGGNADGPTLVGISRFVLIVVLVIIGVSLVRSAWTALGVIYLLAAALVQLWRHGRALAVVLLLCTFIIGGVLVMVAGAVGSK